MLENFLLILNNPIRTKSSFHQSNLIYILLKGIQIINLIHKTITLNQIFISLTST